MPSYDVLAYDEQNNCHKVKDESGVTRLVDLMVNGDFAEDAAPESIVGLKLECDYEYPFISIAMRVRVVQDQPNTTK